jgi:hypothetical protein
MLFLDVRGDEEDAVDKWGEGWERSGDECAER